jgi:peroxiredoxin
VTDLPLQQSRFERARSVWRSPVAIRIRQVGYWTAIAVLVITFYRRVAPTVKFEDLGPAPALEMVDLEGELVRLSDLRGQVVVVNVWATWCPPCRIEMPGFVQLQEEFEGTVQFLGLSMDREPEDVRRFAERVEINFPLLVGRNSGGNGYNTPVLPTTFLIDRDGRVRYRHEGLFLSHAMRRALRALVQE